MYITVKTAVKSKLYLKMQAIKVPCSFNRKVMNFRWGFTWVLMGPFPSLGTVGGGLPMLQHCLKRLNSTLVNQPSF